MDLFRKIFGKTSEELPDPTHREGETRKTPTDEGDGIDATTLPISEDPPPRQNLEGVTQPLNADAVIGNHNDIIAFGQASDVGLVRNNNQDAALSFFSTSKSVEEKPDFGLFVVADGMGGHNEGERAAAITARTLASHVMNTIYIPLLAGSNNDAEQTPITEALVEAVEKANSEVLQQVPEGGTTVTAVAILGDLAYIVHVGDSRAYLMTKDGIEQITRDHSLVQRLIELGQLTDEEAAEHPRKNVLYRALGQSDKVEVDVLKRRLPTNSRLLICSDGLWGQVETREIFEIAMNHPDPQQACDKLVALANTRGGIDNITALLLKIS